jgi:hypothetical protein
MLNLRFTVLTGLVLAAAASRLIPHPYNFTPITAMALFGGAYFSDRRLAFLVPLSAMLASDLFIGLHRGIPVVYGSFALIVCIGFLLRRRRRLLPIAGATLGSSLLFFFLTNFAVWAAGALYPRTLTGLLACFVAAIPFFQNTLLGDAVYSLILFGGFAFAERNFSALRDAPAAVPERA